MAAGETESAIGSAATTAGSAVMAVNPVAGVALMGVGAIASAFGSSKKRKEAERRAREAAAAAQAMYEKMAAKSAQIYQDEIKRAEAAQANIAADLEQTTGLYEQAQAKGDEIAMNAYKEQIAALNTRLTEENRLAKEAYDTGAAKLEELSMAGAKLYQDDLTKATAVRQQFQQQNAAAYATEVGNRAFEDRLTKQVSAQALQEAGLESGTPRGLVAAQSAQDARFEEMKREAERQAVARGEDPRRAALSIEMQQARGAGSLSADYRKNRINELMAIAQGTKLSSGATAAGIAQQGLNAIPTEGRALADYQTKMGLTGLQMQQDYGQGIVNRYTAGAQEGSRLGQDLTAGQISRLGSATSAIAGAQDTAGTRNLNLMAGLRTAQIASVEGANAAYTKVAGMYGDAATANLKTAADSAAAQEKMYGDVAGKMAEAWVKYKTPK